MAKIALTVNGEGYEAEVPSRTLLVDFIRQGLQLTGTHTGCDDGRCGACTVHVDGEPTKSCMVLAAQVDGCSIETVESIGTPEQLSPLQRAFKQHHGLQCGYCTPGMLMSAKDLLKRNPSPTEAEVRHAIAGNICRCTGYHNIVEAIMAGAAEMRGEKVAPAEHKHHQPGGGKDTWVGKRIERSQDARLLTGYGQYAADLAPSNSLHCAILRSPHAHARIKKIDVSKALALPGVIDIITGSDVKRDYKPLPPTINIAMRLNTCYAIAVDKVVYNGEPVAAIAATDPYIAEDALEAIEVEYELLKPVLEPSDALAKDAPLLYEDWQDNKCLEYRFASHGDLRGAIDGSAHKVKLTVPHHRYTAVPLEGRVTLAAWDRGAKKLTVTMSTQAVHQSRTLLAQGLGLPEASVHVITKDVGGGFGLKLQVDGEIIPCMLALRTGKPVLWVETREENLLSGIHSRDYVLEMEGGFDADGRFTALKVDIVGNCGCDGTNRSSGAGQLLVGAFYFQGNYQLPIYETNVLGVVTNKAPYGAYRGYGKDIANLGIERFMEAAAKQIGIDSNELRRRNFIEKEQFPYEILTGAIYDSGDYRTILSMAEEAMNVPEFRTRQEEARKEGRYLGLGFAMVLEPAGGSVPNCIFNAHETTTIRMMPEGDFLVLTGMQEIGQGIETSYAQVVADQLKVSPENIRIICGNTETVPYGLGAWSSRGSSFGVSSAVECAKKLVAKLQAMAGNMLGGQFNDVTHVEGGFEAGGKKITYREIGNGVTLWPGPLVTVPVGTDPNLEATHTWTHSKARWIPSDVGSLSIYTNHSSCCYACEVEVDVETGKISVNRIYAAHDSGVVVNPMIVDGQVHGGVVQGIGGVLNEELRYDADGRLMNKSLWTYLLPQAPDVPKIEVGHWESPSPFTSIGSKGCGEGGPVGVPPAVMNAVEDALKPFGVELSVTPLSPERVLSLIKKAQEKAV
ncbi:molybdopterin-dependent oxidoreductase [Bradyrhizobium sp. CSA207]|nr:molybdopterin-dependent oxidoreductase [Bradyrhizobium sp. CSA207]